MPFDNVPAGAGLPAFSPRDLLDISHALRLAADRCTDNCTAAHAAGAREIGDAFAAQAKRAWTLYYRIAQEAGIAS